MFRCKRARNRQTLSPLTNNVQCGFAETVLTRSVHVLDLQRHSRTSGRPSRLRPDEACRSNCSAHSRQRGNESAGFQKIPFGSSSSATARNCPSRGNAAAAYFSVTLCSLPRCGQAPNACIKSSRTRSPSISEARSGQCTLMQKMVAAAFGPMSVAPDCDTNLISTSRPRRAGCSSAS
eukprot:6190429-Pleurochrysis_carterae.AAC.6